MRFSLCLFLLSVLVTHLSAAEYGSLFHSDGEYDTIVSDVITLNDGDIFEIVGKSSNDSGYMLVIRDERHRRVDSTISHDDLVGKIIVGPCLVGIKKVSMSPNGDEHLRISYKLTRRPDPQTVTTATAN
tara:strand:- start:470 stop:856 length:387 start_codon:yes stop_codon:yes gene_type:complete